MRKFLKDFVQQVTNKKFLAAAGTVIPLLVTHQYPAAAGVAAVYIAAEAHVDGKLAGKVAAEVEHLVAEVTHRPDPTVAVTNVTTPPPVATPPATPPAA